MEPLFFWILAVGLVVSASALVAFRNPVTNAVCLVVALVIQAALFITLEAFFLAAVQVIVYAGAVMVLFLFVIMLLDVKEEARRTPPWVKIVGVLSVGGVAILGLTKGRGVVRPRNWENCSSLPTARFSWRQGFCSWWRPWELSFCVVRTLSHDFR
jgi:NADH:ubiquinone oxidoreductase subunit 6 (subunit J)